MHRQKHGVWLHKYIVSFPTSKAICPPAGLPALAATAGHLARKFADCHTCDHTTDVTGAGGRVIYAAASNATAEPKRTPTNTNQPTYSYMDGNPAPRVAAAKHLSVAQK